MPTVIAREVFCVSGGIPEGFEKSPLLAVPLVGAVPARELDALSEKVVLDVEVEVYADPLEEVVVQRDEADFDRDLEVLQPPQLLQEIDDLLVDLLRLADDEAEVGGEGLDRAGSAHVVPRGGLDGRGDQVDQGCRSRPASRRRVRPVRRLPARFSPSRPAASADWWPSGPARWG